MAMDKRRMKLWGLLIFSIMFTTYQLVFNRPAPRGVPAANSGVPAGEPPPAAAAVPAPDAAAAAPAPVQAAPITPIPAEDLKAWRTGLPTVPRDPFFTLAEIEAMGRPTAIAPVAIAPPAPLPNYTVKFVLMEGSEGRAMIDSRVVEVGDRLGEERVVQILPDAVVLERGGARRRLAVTGSKPVQLTLERTR